MFKAKNHSIQYIAFITALFISLVFSIVIFIVSKKIITTIVILFFFLLVNYFFLNYVFNWYLYRKIKLIYKLIYNTKANKKEEAYYKYLLPKKSLQEVRDEVEIWAIQHKKELELMQKNEEYRKEFLQNLSHELKTPIFTLQGYIETVLSELDETSINNTFLKKANKNIERMVLLVNDLDEITSLETGEQILVKNKFIIQDLIKEVFDSMVSYTKEFNIHSQIKEGCELPIYVYADQEKIRRVLSNLIINASRYGKQNGNIIAGIYKTDDKNVLIEISDDGIGIAEGHLSRIFERFYRTEKGRSRNLGGSGLGLAICKHIIEAHDKTIHVRSTPNVGTTIGFTLDQA